ncbi:hypothetical protein [Streptomyces sp. FH025]|uniref:hypothetical protein n=1 Tax=Streptomyces sp. FH025 TaxID=2815937 RepID=UPI001A9F2D8A|nr:hypothetical protein [Streptomyces sp. FH025]
MVDTDPERARATARAYAAVYLGLPTYVNNLRELGFTEADFKDGGTVQPIADTLEQQLRDLGLLAPVLMPS